MQHLGFTLLQLDEACRYLTDGRVTHLRLALLLLDNAAEIQMQRCIESQVAHEDMRERLRNQVYQILKDQRSTDLQDLIEWQPLSKKQKCAVTRCFEEKVRFLSDRAKRIDVRLVEPLIYLHRYRNEAYHRARVRQATIATATKLLLDINCELLLSLSRDGTNYASDEDYSWLKERFGKTSVSLMNSENLIKNAVNEFRATIGPTDTDVSNLLVEHLESRIEGVFDALDLVVENTRCPDRETAIRDSYHLGMARRGVVGTTKFTSEVVASRHSTSFINELHRKLPEIRGLSDRFEAFRRFAVLESQLESVEENVQELAAEVDEMIQMDIDIARGK